MERPWRADHAAAFHRRLGSTAADLGDSRTTQAPPEIRVPTTATSRSEALNNARQALRIRRVRVSST